MRWKLAACDHDTVAIVRFVSSMRSATTILEQAHRYRGTCSRSVGAWPAEATGEVQETAQMVGSTVLKVYTDWLAALNERNWDRFTSYLAPDAEFVFTHLLPDVSAKFS